MFFQFFLNLLFLCCAFAAITLDGEVLVLDDDNFAEATKKHEQLLVEFYAPWCGHCKTLAPEWTKAAVTSKDAPIKMAKVDATASKKLAETFKIQGFPTIKYFKQGIPSEYDGGRTEKDIVAWIKRKSGPPAETLNDEDDLAKFQGSDEAVVIGVFSGVDSNEAKEFVKYAGVSTIEVPYAVTTSAAVKAKLGVTKDTIVVLKTFDEKRNELEVISDKFNGVSLDNFVATATTPNVQTFSQEKSKKIFGSKIKKHALLFSDDSESYHEAILAGYSTIAKANKGELLFVSVPPSNDGILNYFGLTKQDLPQLVIVDMTTAIKKYPIYGEVTVDSMGEHVKAFLAGNLLPTLKSEQPDPEDTAGNVKIVKGKTFKEIVLNNKKDVLFEIYAPWCGHCKKLAPVYEQLGEEYSLSDNILIAKMDGTANEIDYPGLETSGYPSIFWIPGNTKFPEKYTGGREKEDFVAFIKEHSTAALQAEAGQVRSEEL